MESLMEMAKVMGAVDIKNIDAARTYRTISGARLVFAWRYVVGFSLASSFGNRAARVLQSTGKIDGGAYFNRNAQGLADFLAIVGSITDGDIENARQFERDRVSVSKAADKRAMVRAADRFENITPSALADLSAAIRDILTSGVTERTVSIAQPKAIGGRAEHTLRIIDVIGDTFYRRVGNYASNRAL